MAERIERDGVEARDELQAFMAERVWADGWLELAQLDRAAGDLVAAYDHALRAVRDLATSGRRGPAVDVIRATAMALAMESAISYGRPATVLELLATFGEAADPDGQVHFWAARAALLVGERAQARELLSRAKALATDDGGALPSAFIDLEADWYLASAEASTGAERREAMATAIDLYQRSLAADFKPDAAFNLGLLQQRMARLVDPGEARGWLEAAMASYRKVTGHQATDTDARFQYGMAALAAGQPEAAFEAFELVLHQYRHGVAATPADWQLAATHRGRATALLRLHERDPQNWDPAAAVADLERAEALGDTSAELYNNLLVALLAVADQAGADAGPIRARIDRLITEHGRLIDPVNLGVSLIERARAALASDDPTRRERGRQEAATAAEVFAWNLTPADDPAAWTVGADESAVLWRWFAHAQRLQAELTSADAPEDAAAAWQRALAAYRAAGAAGDAAAREHYLAAASTRAPTTAYRAAVDVLRWRHFLSLDAWRLAIASYASSGAWRQPLHLGVWGGLFLLCLVLGFRSRAKRKRAAAAAESPPRAPSRPPAGERGEPPAAQPGTGGDAAPETLRPKTMVRKPARGQALERRPSGETDVRARSPRPEQRPLDETYRPGDIPPEAAQARRAVSDIARRLAREQEQGKGDEPDYRPRKSPRPRKRR